MHATSVRSCFLELVSTILIGGIPYSFILKISILKCYSFIFLLAGSFRAVITDGVTLGHPCCKVDNCTNPLPSNRAHFCDSLEDDHHLLKELCVVTGCDKKAEKDHLTCSHKEHRELEEQRKGSGKAFFRLRDSLYDKMFCSSRTQ